MSRRRCPVALVLMLVCAGLSGCGGASAAAIGRFTDTSKVSVAASFYPLAEAASAVGGSRVEVLDLTPVGSSPHAIDLTARSVQELENADVVFFLSKGFQPSVEKAVSSLPGSARPVDLLPNDLLPVDSPLAGVVGDVDGEVLAGGTDPHVWLDPVRFAAMVGAIASALSELDPAGRAEFTSNAQRYTAALAALDGEFRSGLSNCESRVIVTSHRAFGYLASRYNLRQIPIAGIAPDEEPNPRSMAAVSAAARRENVKTVFFESLVPRKLADTIAKEIGAATDALNPIEGLTAAERTQGLTYRSIQRDNLASLRRGLGCTGE